MSLPINEYHFFTLAPHVLCYYCTCTLTGLVQAAVDVDMAAAEETVRKMRDLRMVLGGRMRQLDALNSSLGYHAGAFNNNSSTGNGQYPQGMPLYARPGGPPPAPGGGGGGGYYPAGEPVRFSAGHPAAGHHLPAYPAGLSPMAQYDYLPSGQQQQHPFPYPHPQQQQPGMYWGLESYYAAQEQARLDATQDSRALFNPFPDLVHSNIYGVSKGVHSALDVAMDTLNKRLPGDKAAMTAMVAAASASAAASTAAAKSLNEAMAAASKTIAGVSNSSPSLEAKVSPRTAGKVYILYIL